jgi:hypothetical protein
MATEMQKAEARQIRDAQDVVIKHMDTDAPAVVNDIMSIIREWEPGKYVIGDLRIENNIPYRCVQAHDSTPNPQWKPSTVPALWAEYHGTSIETARPYKAPQGAHDAYMKDEYQIWTDGYIYRCKKDSTVHDPAVLPASWEKIQPASETTPPTEPEPEEPETPEEPEPVDEWPAWVQPGSTNPYQVGDKVSHKGKHWLNNTANNVWEPGVYGWTEQQ